MNKAGYNTSAMKKIIGVMFVAIFAGVPFLAMADPSSAFRYCNMPFGSEVTQQTFTASTPDECTAVANSYISSTAYFYNISNYCAVALPATVGSCGGVSGEGGGGGVSGRGGGGTSVSVSVPLMNPIKYNTFSSFVSKVTATAVEILMPFVVLAFIYSGFLFVRAQGNETELKEAKSAIKWSIIGAFILMGAYGFSQIICTTVESLTADGTSISSCR